MDKCKLNRKSYHSRSADKTRSNAEYTRKYFDGVAEGEALSCSRRSLAND